MKKELKEIITEMKLMLNENPTLTLENFIMPESFDSDFSENDTFTDENGYKDVPQVNQPKDKVEEPIENKISGIEKELTQIRKIALNVITRLADQPSSEQYILMKKIWNTVDKAIENGNEKSME